MSQASVTTQGQFAGDGKMSIPEVAFGAQATSMRGCRGTRLCDENSYALSDFTGRYLITEEVAELLHLSRRSVHELTRTCRIPHRCPAGMRRNLFIADEIQAWLDGCELEVVTSSDGGRVIRPASGH